jgi:hypothetical protein
MLLSELNSLTYLLGLNQFLPTLPWLNISEKIDTLLLLGSEKENLKNPHSFFGKKKLFMF